MLASKTTADGQYWARIMSLFSQGYSYAHISLKLESETNQKWDVERVRSVVRRMRDNTELAGIPPMGDVVDNDLLKGETRTLVLSDLHAPHTLPIVEHIVEAHKGWDGLDLNGDILDYDYVSTHNGSKAIPLAHEYTYMHPRLKRWGEWFRRKRIRPGNHEERLRRFFHNRIDGSLNFLLGERTDPLAALLGGFALQEKSGPADSPVVVKKTYEPLAGWDYTDWWFSRYGDVIIFHPSGFNSPPMKTVHEFDGWFRDWGLKYRLIAMGHTHKSGTAQTTTWPKRTLIETGCLCSTMDYQIKSGKKTYRPQSIGFLELYLYNGEVDVERTRQVVVS